MKRRNVLKAGAVLSGILVTQSGVGIAQSSDDVMAAMQRLKAKATALGTPHIEAQQPLGGTPIPVLYFGQTKINGNFGLVDGLQMNEGGTATIFVKNGDDFYRVTTNVKKADGTRALGTVLDLQGQARPLLTKGESFQGVVDVLGRAYLSRYEPLFDEHRTVIGAYYVGYPQT